MNATTATTANTLNNDKTRITSKLNLLFSPSPTLWLEKRRTLAYSICGSFLVLMARVKWMAAGGKGSAESLEVNCLW